MKFNKFFSSLLVIQLLLLTNHQVSGQKDYSRILESGNDSKMKITITSNDTYNLLEESDYRYFVEVEAIEFATNQDRFHSMTVQIQLRLTNQTLQSEENLADLNGINETSNTLVSIEYTPIDNLISGENNWTVEFRLIYKEGLILQTDPTITTDWMDLAKGGLIYDPSDPLFEGDFIPIGIVLVMLLGGGGTIIFNRYNSRKNRLKDKFEEVSDFIDKRGQCPNCNEKTKIKDEFCATCGYKIKSGE
ncbi:MAG: hypothetical protein HeimC3_48260 [Candidatus Heimdallarchaeota archaeon LC_3]|nr:MAG: hypothetical protein HeimC3_48260 [Candidatus Heimdallarchaeota archaeon LC_3]